MELEHASTEKFSLQQPRLTHEFMMREIEVLFPFMHFFKLEFRNISKI
jgi:hypothetical protein